MGGPQLSTQRPPNIVTDLNDQLCQQNEDDMFDHDILENYAPQFLDTKYEQVDINKFAVNQKHLTPNQHHDLQIY